MKYDYSKQKPQEMPTGEHVGGPSNLRVRPVAPAPATATAPQQTPATSFREGMEDFGTSAAGAITRGYDDEIVGWLGTLQGRPFEQGQAEQNARKAAAEERSPAASLGGSIAGSALAPGGTAGDIAASGLNAAINPGSAGSMLQDMLVAGTLSRISRGKTAATARTASIKPQQIISARNLARPREEIVQSAMDMARAGDKAGIPLANRLHPQLADLPAPTPGVAAPVSVPHRRNYGGVMPQPEAAAAPVATTSVVPPVSAEQRLADQMQLEAFMAKRRQGMTK